MSKQPRTESELYAEILKTKNGIAFAEMHSANNDIHSIIKNMDTFKKSGVDTIYMEGDRNVIEAFGTAPLDKLHLVKNMLISVRDHPAKPENTEFAKVMKLEAGLYGSEMSPRQLANHYIEFTNLAITAREHGIRVKHMDGTAVEVLKNMNSMQDRVEFGNKRWPQEIAKDRKLIDPHGHGKFVAIGGFLHFNNTSLGHGTVAEQMGMAVVAHTKSAPWDALDFSPIKKGKVAGGPDYWLESGPLHRDLAKYADLQKLDDKTARQLGEIKSHLQEKSVKSQGENIHDGKTVKEPHVNAQKSSEQTRPHLH